MLLDKIKRLKELTEQLNHYRDSYYNNSESLISDKQYDDLFDDKGEYDCDDIIQKAKAFYEEKVSKDLSVYMLMNYC